MPVPCAGPEGRLALHSRQALSPLRTTQVLSRFLLNRRPVSGGRYKRPDRKPPRRRADLWPGHSGPQTLRLRAPAWWSLPRDPSQAPLPPTPRPLVGADSRQKRASVPRRDNGGREGSHAVPGAYPRTVPQGPWASLAASAGWDGRTVNTRRGPREAERGSPPTEPLLVGAAVGAADGRGRWGPGRSS